MWHLFRVYTDWLRKCDLINWLVNKWDIWLSGRVVDFIWRSPGPEVIKLEYIVKLKIKLNDLLLADICPQAANH